MAKKIDFTTTKRGKRALLYEGFRYTCQRQADGDKPSQWMCVDRTCKGRGHLSADEKQWTLKQEHNHLPEFGEVAANKVKSDIKIAAESSGAVEPCLLTQKAYGEANEETLQHLPKEKSMKRTIQRSRRKKYPTEPKSLDELEHISLEYQVIESEQWLQYDSGIDEDNRVLIFGRKSTLKEMSRSRNWLGDGTFKTAPHLFLQIYSLHYELHGQIENSHLRSQLHAILALPFLPVAEVPEGLQLLEKHTDALFKETLQNVSGTFVTPFWEIGKEI
ncbi:unnamed protein product [Notodromas monacha]|uniref:FLYWCH-type domain-containing protein n=1 Tax=Notodromas monacha TaxID=399045 RepID=A0A7R9BH56_9CRUS|nr:unnamed protein product [Notodromas monacha]CAG0914575.1 unnamed protein product [Notodromas monacha]